MTKRRSYELGLILMNSVAGIPHIDAARKKVDKIFAGLLPPDTIFTEEQIPVVLSRRLISLFSELNCETAPRIADRLNRINTGKEDLPSELAIYVTGVSPEELVA